MIAKIRVIAYSLLAHINDHNDGISDLCDIFSPLVKRVLSNLCTKGMKAGQPPDLKKEIDKEYGFDIPYPILNKILTKIESDHLNDNPVPIKVHSDGSFILCRDAFSEFKDLLVEQESEIDWLNEQYENYLKYNSIDPTLEPTIFEFLDTNRLELSSFISSRKEVEEMPLFSHQVSFVNSIKSSSKEYSIMRKIYLGSVITSYLEMNIGKIESKGVELLLDTSFVVGLVGLASIESEHTCNAVIRIAKSIGYKLSILDITLKEIKSLLTRIASTLDHTILTSTYDTESIEHSCERQNISRTDLERRGMKLKDVIENDFGIKVIPVSHELEEEAIKSDIYKNTIKRKFNPDGAPHDGIALYYTQKMRGRNVFNFSDVKCFFVGNSKFITQSNLYRSDGTITLKIRADYLVSILWLAHPTNLGKDFADIGLTRLISTTIRRNLPSPQLFHELDENIRKYVIMEIGPSELALVANSVALKTNENLQNLNKVAKNSPEEFIKEVKRLVQIEKEDRNKEKENAERSIANFQNSLKEKASLIEETIKKNEEKFKNKNTSYLTSSFESVDNEIKHLTDIINSLANDAKKIVDTNINNFVILCLIPLSLLIIYKKDQFGLIADILGFIILLFGLIYFTIRKKVFDALEIYENMVKSQTNKQLIKHCFNQKHYDSLIEKREKLKTQLYNNINQ